MRWGLLAAAAGLALALLPASAAWAQSYERRLDRARDLYLEVEFDEAISELRGALSDRDITDDARREALMLLGTIQVAQGNLSAAASTFAEVRVRWPDYEPARNVPPSAREVFGAVPQAELDRVAREIGPASRRGRPPPRRGVERRGRQRGPDGGALGPDRDRDGAREHGDDDRSGGGIPVAAIIGGGAVLVAAALVITVLVVTADNRATVTVRFTD